MAIIDVIIPSYNNLPELKRCIQGFIDQTFKNFRLIICVDGSTDGTIEYIKNLDVPLECEMAAHNFGQHLGRSATRNLAIPILNAPYLVMTDSDILPARDLLERHYRLLKNRDCISLGEVLYTNQSKNIWADYIQSRGKNKFKNMDCLPAQYVTTGNLAMKTLYFIEIGGQDANMVYYGGEDTEMAYRIYQTFHLPIIYNKYCVGFSVMKKNLLSALDQMREFGAGNLSYIRKKHPEFNRLFRMDHLESNRLIDRIIRSFLTEKTCKLCIQLIPFCCGPVRRKLIHFLVMFNIYQGYQSSKRDEENI